MRPTFDKTAFLSAATELLEDVVPSGPLGLGDVPIRELTAAQRLEAVEVAKVLDAQGEEITLPDGTTKIDNSTHAAALIAMAVLDPATCYDGQVFTPGKGRPLLGPDDIATLATQGREALNLLAQRIMNLSWMTRGSLFRLRPETDPGQPTAPAGDRPARNGADSDGSSNGDDGVAVGAGDVPDVAGVA